MKNKQKGCKKRTYSNVTLVVFAREEINYILSYIILRILKVEEHSYINYHPGSAPVTNTGYHQYHQKSLSPMFFSAIIVFSVLK